MTAPTDTAPEFKAVILAAGMGSRIRPLTDECPKTLLTVGTTTILERMLTTLRSYGIEDVVIVVGYLSEKIESFVSDHFGDMNIELVTNSRYDETNTGYSLMLAEGFIGGDAYIGVVSAEDGNIRDVNSIWRINRQALDIRRSAPGGEMLFSGLCDRRAPAQR